ncbi:MAG TPA: VWA domain-containing protein, partial [Candidatus Cloacimonadota bacterium]|nr:VWA domain-containing protein [Candidatus Cloacimonadota bacterium]
MSKKRLYVTFLLIALAFSLLATQEPVFPKGCFNEFPQPRHQNSRLDAKASSGARQVVWSETFESTSPWQLENNWEIGDPSMGPNGAAEGQHCLATGLDELYANHANITATSPLITLPAASYVELNFSEWFELESSWDFAYVEVIQGTSTFTIDARTGTSGSMYRNTSLNLSRFQNCSIKLQFHLVSDGSVPAAGWYIDALSITAVEPLPMDLHISAVNHSHYPSVYLSASVNSPQGLITDLNTTHFTALENGIPQQDLFTVISPGVDQISAADIVFVLDVTGSMGDEIESVRTNMNSFMNQLQGEGIDYRVGFVVFGDIVHVYNAYQFYTDYAQIMDVINNIQLGEHGIGSGGDGPENQVEASLSGPILFKKDSV